MSQAEVNVTMMRMRMTMRRMDEKKKKKKKTTKKKKQEEEEKEKQMMISGYHLFLDKVPIAVSTLLMKSWP